MPNNPPGFMIKISHPLHYRVQRPEEGGYIAYLGNGKEGALEAGAKWVREYS